ncbi:somatostatin-2-like isoform X2 [Ahaetulla prasina]|uniref:somatostatin-2-like isoform X2 n=1 Tax=Ahaetulla prasina TaxID=499056 RepID=UPI0026496A27|nr:somatostatin-2-like isoform X2 [Ahaetulla prasina]XP_058016973.1 somatostatin-2-like isoform X2 [Ahaetulla prasina]XP_058016974.1 somatostatin-2-like isoform X2 [Ahaetulla prasina]
MFRTEPDSYRGANDRLNNSAVELDQQLLGRGQDKKQWRNFLTEQLKAQKSLVLKMLAGLLNSVDADRDAFADFEDPPGRKLEDEPLTLGQSPHLSPRDRKTPCKNFFWKTFTAC